MNCKICEHLSNGICYLNGLCEHQDRTVKCVPRQLPSIMPPSGVDAWTAMQEQGITREEFLSWEFKGYDDNGMQVRMPPPDIVIVSRHAGAVEWLRRQGIKGKVIAHATADDVRGCEVYGNLPLHLAAEAASVTIISLPDLRPDQRGKDLSPAEMDTTGAHLESFEVRRV